MKKKLLGAIALGLCVFGMAGCDVINGFLGNSSTPAAEPDFAGVRGYLLEAYEPYEEGRIDYEVTNQLPIGDFVYDINWSIEFKDTTADIKAVRGESTTTHTRCSRVLRWPELQNHTSL